jgi:transposase
MRIIGLDLSLDSEHRAVFLDTNGQLVRPALRVKAQPAEWAGLIEQARAGAAADEPVGVVVEPSGYTSLPLIKYLAQQPGVKVYLLNPQQLVARVLTLSLNGNPA